LTVVIASFIFSYFSFSNLKLPGTREEEPSVAIQLFPFLGLVEGVNELPLLFHPYHAAGMSYLILPWMYLLDVNVYAIRTGTIVYGFITLILLFIFVKKISNVYFAAISFFMLATNPSFIISVREGLVHISLPMLFSVLSLFLFNIYRDKKNLFYMFLVGLTLGLGMSCHSSFIYFITAMSVVVFIKIIFKRNRKKLLQITLFFLGIFIGSGLLILGNLRNNFSTIKEFESRILQTPMGINNTEYFENLKARIRNSIDLIEGIAFQDYEGGQNWYSYKNKFNLYLLIISIIFVLYKKIFVRVKLLKVIDLLLLLLVFMVVSPFTLNKHEYSHVLSILPVLAILSGWTVYYLFHNSMYSQSKSGEWIKYIACVIIIFVIGFKNLASISAYHSFIKRTGGVGIYSDAIYKLSDWLETNNYNIVVAGDWGFSANIEFHTKRKILVDWIYPSNDSFPLTNELELIYYFKNLFNEPNKIFIFRYRTKNFNIVNTFAKKINKKLVLIKTFFRRDNVPIYQVYKAVDIKN